MSAHSGRLSSYTMHHMACHMAGYPVIPCTTWHAIWQVIQSYHAMSCHMAGYPVIPCYVMPCQWTMPCHTHTSASPYNNVAATTASIMPYTAVCICCIHACWFLHVLHECMHASLARMGADIIRRKRCMLHGMAAYVVHAALCHAFIVHGIAEFGESDASLASSIV